METLSQRQNTILRGVVETHIETSQPVGSRLIAEKYAFSFSPATIRNEMGCLEEQGYLTHPHTSSGRVPTDRGYRYYLDHTPFEQAPSWDDFDRVAEELSSSVAAGGERRFWDQVALFLFLMTHEVSLTLLPFPGPFPSEKEETPRISLQGLTNILEKPEFQDLGRIRSLLQALEEKGTLTRWILKNASGEQVSVLVGREHAYEALEDCAIVTARYAAGKEHQGAIAVLGPKRMPYRLVVPLVSRVSHVIGELIENLDLED